MGEIVQREIASLTHKDNDLLTADVPREHVYLDLVLRIVGELNVTVAATLTEWSILNLIKNIQLKGNGTLTPKDMNGIFAYLRSKYEGQVAPTFNAPAVGVAVNKFDFSVPIRFILPPSYGGDRFDSAFDSDPFKTLQLILSTGDVDDVISAGTATLQNLTYSVHTLEIENLTNKLLHLNIENQSDKAFTAANTALDHELPRGDNLLYRSLAIRVLDNGVMSDTVLNSVQLRSNGTKVHVDIKWDELLDRNKEQYHLETIATGFGIIDLDPRHNFAELIPMINKSNFKLIYNVNAPGGANGLIQVLPSIIVINQAA